MNKVISNKRKPRLFFKENGDDEFCYNLKYFKTEMIVGQEDIILREAKISYGDKTFYCKVHGFCGTVYDAECGSDCNEYEPRNGKNGRCGHSKNCYEPGNRVFTLTISKTGKFKLIELHVKLN